MIPRRTLFTAAAVLVTAAAVQPSLAAPRKPISGKFDFRDPTPDPTGNAESSEDRHCSGKLPQEKPYEITMPAPGKLKVTIADFVGDWSLQIRDSKGNVVGGVDVNPPATESVTIKIKKAGKVQVLPCNLGGSPDAKGSYLITF